MENDTYIWFGDAALVYVCLDVSEWQLQPTIQTLFRWVYSKFEDIYWRRFPQLLRTKKQNKNEEEKGWCLG